MDNNFGIKDLYKGYLLAGPKTTLNGYQYQENEIILEFDDIQKIAFGEDIQSISARGGYQNPTLINWESVRQMYGAIDMGRVSPNTFALLSRSNITTVEDSSKSIPNTETKYVEDDGIIYLEHELNTSYPIRIWKLQRGIKSNEIVDYELEDNTIKIEDTNVDVLITYWYDVEVNYQTIDVGAKDFNGYLKFVGKFYYTGENTSDRKTAIIEIPKTDETIKLIDYVNNTLMDLKTYLNDYVVNTYDSCTYLQNTVNFQKFLTVFDSIRAIFEDIKSGTTDTTEEEQILIRLGYL